MRLSLAELRALALELSEVAEMADDPAISPRLTEMASEVLGLVDQNVCESRVYDSATFFGDIQRTNTDRDSDAHDSSPRQAQRR
ncbi:MAG TPA: hypothetical protein VFL55_23285 [Acetobacteraceae bacterium]|jgi:hypothetical protein|nr:hypothetical protein [Acetobacteraceae bacterium]